MLIAALYKIRACQENSAGSLRKNITSHHHINTFFVIVVQMLPFHSISYGNLGTYSIRLLMATGTLQDGNRTVFCIIKLYKHWSQERIAWGVFREANMKH